MLRPDGFSSGGMPLLLVRQQTADIFLRTTFNQSPPLLHPCAKMSPGRRRQEGN